MNIAKKLYAWVSQLMMSIVSLMSVLFFSRCHKNSLKTLKKVLKDKTSCYILGNGPSLKSFIKENEGEIIKQTTMVVNNFCDSPPFFTLKPLLYIIIDPAYFRNPKKDAGAMQLVRALNKVDWDMYLIVPNEFKKCETRTMINNDRISYIYINKVPVSGFEGLNHLIYRKNLGMPLPQNVLNAAIFCGINAGFKELRIYGADHSWSQDVAVYKNNKVCYVENHFYDKEKTYHEMEGFTISSFFLALAKAFDSHMKLRRYADSVGCNIVNCTPDSFIDAYEREEN